MYVRKYRLSAGPDDASFNLFLRRRSGKSYRGTERPIRSRGRGSFSVLEIPLRLPIASRSWLWTVEDARCDDKFAHSISLSPSLFADEGIDGAMRCYASAAVDNVTLHKTHARACAHHAHMHAWACVDTYDALLVTYVRDTSRGGYAHARARVRAHARRTHHRALRTFNVCARV